MPDIAARPKNPFIPFADSQIHQSIPQRFVQIVHKYGERLAVKDSVREYTYQALNEMANRVAWSILAEGTGSAPTVALLVEERALSIAALMGVLKAGRAYVPLDPSYPRARNVYMLQDSLADLIIADAKGLALAQELTRSGGIEGCRVIDVTALAPELPVHDPELALSPDAYAYILYTSGTTGQPKGVLGSHRQVLQFTKMTINAHHICHEDRLSLVASLCFSGSLTYLFPALCSGAALVAFDTQVGVDRIAGWLVEQRITIYGSVPMMWRQMCATLPEGFRFPDLRAIRVGGDRIDKADLALYKKHCSSSCAFWIGYAATEAKSISHIFMNHDTEISGDTMPVGYAARDVELLVFDPDGRPAAPGTVGQVAVKSRYLAPGYWNNPEATADKFLPDPAPDDVLAADLPAVRVYLMGDLGRLASDGCLTHLGRVDSQVKIRGFRIEIAEVEGALLELVAVRQAAVVVHSGPNGDPQLVAYVVPAVRPAPTVSGLRRSLKERLPHYMIPALFVMLDEMPINANNKIDRRALPAPEMTRPKLAVEYVAPRDEVERGLVDIWEQILGVSPIGAQDDFFELGGHSLLAVRLFARIAQRWGRELPLLTLLQAPTVEQLAGLLHQGDPDREQSLLVPIQPGGTRLPFFCVIPPRSSAVGLAGLATHLGSDQPVYGLQYHRLHARDEAQGFASDAMPSVEQLAQLYIQELRAVQPEGPYALGGRCFGGTIAFEMAQQLLEEGERVELLALIGSAPVNYARSTKHLAERMIYHRRQGRLLPVLLEYIPIKAAKVRRRLAWKAKQWAGQKAGRQRQGNGARYVPQVYAGRVTVFQTTEALRDAWSELAAAGVEYHVIEGTHHDMFREPLVADLAARLNTCLGQALDKVVATL